MTDVFSGDDLEWHDFVVPFSVKVQGPNGAESRAVRRMALYDGPVGHSGVQFSEAHEGIVLCKVDGFLSARRADR